MVNPTQQSDTDQPPIPGGDPDQPPSDLPTPNSDKSRGGAGSDENGEKGYGKIRKKEIPPPEGAPKPHEIF